jgi:hypothetical protein
MAGLKLIAATIGFIAWSAGASNAQQLTKEQTYEDIARTMATINAKLRPGVAPAGAGAEFYARLLKETLALADDLRARLASNPYVKVKGFHIGLPAGVSMDFEFKD